MVAAQARPTMTGVRRRSRWIMNCARLVSDSSISDHRSFVLQALTTLSLGVSPMGSRESGGGQTIATAAAPRGRPPREMSHQVRCARGAPTQHTPWRATCADPAHAAADDASTPPPLQFGTHRPRPTTPRGRNNSRRTQYLLRPPQAIASAGVGAEGYCVRCLWAAYK